MTDRRTEIETDPKLTDATLDVSSADRPVGTSGIRPFELVEGSGSGMSNEFNQLLHCRTRLASLMLSIGFGLFLVRNLVWPPAREQVGLGLFVLHIAVTGILAVIGLSLCRKCHVSSWRLRAQELIVFGLPAVFLLIIQYRDVQSCTAMGYLPSLVSPWMLLIFTYSILIPNRWQRAALVISALALAPIVLTSWLMYSDSACQMAVNAGFVHLSGQGLSLLITAVVAGVSARTLRVLRTEAFEARQLGQYRLKQHIGAGGMGDVYLAEHQMLRRPCAIKLIQPDRAGDPRALARFEREVHSIAQLSHWNSVDIYDYGRASDGTFYYVMEYLPGLSLQQLVDRHGPLDGDRAIHLLRQVCDALHEAHSQGIIHRDIKPSNIFAAHRGGRHDVAKLLDFGLAKPVNHSSDDAELTGEGMISGSPRYMSPEQAVGETEPDQRSDIYSLGAVAYFIMTGRPPFDSSKPLSVILAHVNKQLVPPSEHRPSITPCLEAIIMRCLAKDPADRFENVQSLAEALAACAETPWTQTQANAWWNEHTAPTEARVEDVALV